MYYVEKCEEDDTSWTEISGQFDSDGQLYIGVLNRLTKMVR